jgi:hypothetical protein
VTRIVSTDKDGYYIFDEVEVGRYYVMTPLSRRFTFTPANYSFEVLEKLNDLNFSTEP